MEIVTNSSIFIVNSIEDSLSKILAVYPTHQTRVIKNEEKDEFQIEQANKTLKESYIASNETKYLFLCGATFRVEAQNALLKILEEPPKNIVFILLVSSKNSLLPTIYSRLPYKNLKKVVNKDDIELNIKKLDLKDIYTFIKNSQKITKSSFLWIFDEERQGSLNLKSNDDGLDMKLLQMFRLYNKTLSAALFANINVES